MNFAACNILSCENKGFINIQISVGWSTTFQDAINSKLLFPIPKHREEETQNTHTQTHTHTHTQTHIHTETQTHTTASINSTTHTQLLNAQQHKESLL